MPGKYYVYGWFNNDRKAYFYIGSGCGDRYQERRGRGLAFNAILKNWDCEPEILQKGLSRIEALDAAERLKRALIYEEGNPILDNDQACGGRQRLKIDMVKFITVYEHVRNGDCTNRDAMKQLKLSHTTYYRLVREYKSHTGRFEGIK